MRSIPGIAREVNMRTGEATCLVPQNGIVGFPAGKRNEPFIPDPPIRSGGPVDSAADRSLLENRHDTLGKGAHVALRLLARAAVLGIAHDPAGHYRCGRFLGIDFTVQLAVVGKTMLHRPYGLEAKGFGEVGEAQVVLVDRKIGRPFAGILKNDTGVDVYLLPLTW